MLKRNAQQGTPGLTINHIHNEAAQKLDAAFDEQAAGIQPVAEEYVAPVSIETVKPEDPL